MERSYPLSAAPGLERRRKGTVGFWPESPVRIAGSRVAVSSSVFPEVFTSNGVPKSSMPR